MKFKQSESFGCGLFAVANTLDLSSFITVERLRLSKENGNTIGQLSRWLQDDGHTLAIDTLYYNHLGKKLPATALLYRPLGEEAIFLPILLNVRFSQEGKNHLVGGRIRKDGVLYLYDSLNEDEVKTTLTKVNKAYHNVYGLFVFVDVETGQYIFC